MTAAITSGVMAAGVLEPSMDAQAVNHQQGKLIDCPETPGADSLVELLLQQMHTTLALADLVAKLAKTNGIELGLQRQITGVADQIVTCLHDVETNTDAGQRPVSGRDIAHRLIPILDRAKTGDRKALDEVRRLVRHIPASVLLREAVTYHLGAGRTRLLRTIIAAKAGA